MRLLLKMLAWLIPLVVLPLAVVSWIALQSLQLAASEQAHKQLEGIAGEVGHLATSSMVRIIGNLDAISQDQLLLQYLQATETDRYTLFQGPILRKFKALQTAYPEYHSLELYTADKQRRALRYNGEPVTFPEALVAEAMSRAGNKPANPVIMLPPTFRSDTPHLLLATAITGPRHPNNPAVTGTLGYLVTALDAQFLQDILATAAHGNDGTFVIHTPDGIPLLNTAPALLRQLPTRNDRLDLQRISGDLLTIGDTAFLGRQYHLLEDMELLALKPLASLEATSTQLERHVALIAVSMAAIAVIVLYLVITRIITRPLLQLSLATRAIATGNDPVNIDIKQTDEVGDLGRDLADMHRQLKRSTEQITELAFYDRLTGLPNKTSFYDGIRNLIRQAEENDTMMAVLFFDLDNFKTVNDSLGHQHGDDLLKQVGTRLRECIRGSDMLHGASFLQREVDQSILARLGGDEFTLAIANIHDARQASRVAVRILTKLATPFRLDDNEVFVGASIGIALYPRDGTNADELLKNADIAMYEAKSRGKNNFQLFDQNMNSSVNERLALESAMRNALDQREFFLVYQPKVPTGNERCYEFEALLRWRHPQRGFISPAVFIPIAEETGLIQPIGEWILMSACEQIRHWLDQGYDNVRVSVNLSPVQMNFGNPIGSITGSLNRHDVAPRHLEIEITESGLMRNEQNATAILHHLKELGVQIALDDFGTGYSSLAYLRRFPIDVLKIDRAFVMDVETDPDSAKVLDAVIALAKSLNLHVVAEGVETRGQVEFLAARGCNRIQGYYYARPSVPHEAIEFFDALYAERDACSFMGLDKTATQR